MKQLNIKRHKKRKNIFCFPSKKKNITLLYKRAFFMQILKFKKPIGLRVDDLALKNRL